MKPTRTRGIQLRPSRPTQDPAFLSSGYDCIRQETPRAVLAYHRSKRPASGTNAAMPPSTGLVVVHYQNSWCLVAKQPRSWRIYGRIFAHEVHRRYCRDVLLATAAPRHVFTALLASAFVSLASAAKCGGLDIRHLLSSAPHHECPCRRLAIIMSVHLAPYLKRKYCFRVENTLKTRVNKRLELAMPKLQAACSRLHKIASNRLR